ncbi:MAG TPA: sigma-70 family RNA polymerase sigma factor [Gemmatimonadaceae bacterium]|nr:sigma-70 family RNA polymerase sigma factor [Gemmatimonadaceae bacterium]
MKRLADGAAVNRGDDGDPGQPDAVVRRAQGGDVDAFEAVYRAHAPAIHALCRRMSGEDAEANELVQDVFVRAWERLPSFRGQSSLATWLHRLAVNEVLEKWRSNKREALRMIDDADGLALDAWQAQHDPDVLMDVEAAMTRLPAGSRTVFVLHDIEGYSHDEIASMTGIAAGTSRTQLFRARRALARVLEP